MVAKAPSQEIVVEMPHVASLLSKHDAVVKRTRYN
jgi:hypothetical protein